MNNIKQFNSFQTSFKKLNEKASNDLLSINIEYYHHDSHSEPFFHVEGSVKNILLENVETHGYVVTILTSETNISFTEANYHTNLSNDAVVFASKKDEETYCIITFI